MQNLGVHESHKKEILNLNFTDELLAYPTNHFISLKTSFEDFSRWQVLVGNQVIQCFQAFLDARSTPNSLTRLVFTSLLDVIRDVWLCKTFYRQFLSVCSGCKPR